MDQNEKSDVGTSIAGCPGGRDQRRIDGGGCLISRTDKRQAVPSGTWAFVAREEARLHTAGHEARGEWMVQRGFRANGGELLLGGLT